MFSITLGMNNNRSAERMCSKWLFDEWVELFGVEVTEIKKTNVRYFTEKAKQNNIYALKAVKSYNIYLNILNWFDW